MHSDLWNLHKLVSLLWKTNLMWQETGVWKNIKKNIIIIFFLGGGGNRDFT